MLIMKKRLRRLVLSVRLLLLRRYNRLNVGLNNDGLVKAQ